MPQPFYQVFAWCALVCLANPAHAGIALSASRLVYPENVREISLVVRNESTHEILLQSWLEAVEPLANGPSTAALPLAITPALAHMKGKARQTLRIMYSGAGFPADRESLAWLNVQEIPQTSAVDNVLQLAIRQRIKVFFRPTGIEADIRLAPLQLQWHLEKGHVKVINPGPYHISLAGLSFEGLAAAAFVRSSDMVGPFETQHLALKGGSAHPPLGNAPVLKFSSIDDHGARQPHRVVFDNHNASQASPVR